jgi:hypothetical protein
VRDIFTSTSYVFIKQSSFRAILFIRAGSPLQYIDKFLKVFRNTTFMTRDGCKSERESVGSNTNNNKYAYAGTTDSFTHLRVLLVLTDRGIKAVLLILSDSESAESVNQSAESVNRSLCAVHGRAHRPRQPLRLPLWRPKAVLPPWILLTS